jgi:hypothetical protein
MAKITRQTKKDIEYRIQEEGFDYTFLHYSEWVEINDPKFHRLRTAFEKTREELEKHVVSLGIKI